MFGWLNFFMFIFWCSILLFASNVHFLFLLMYAEFTWLVLYVIALCIGTQIDDLTSITFPFFILGFGGLEFVIGLMLVIFFKNLKISTVSEQTVSTNNILINNVGTKQII